MGIEHTMKYSGFILVSMLSLAQACDSSRERLSSQFGTLQLSIEPETILVSEPFQVTLTFCDQEPSATVKNIDAWMPAHNHGMNYSPKLVDINAKQVTAEGFVFHMPGQWQFEVELQDDSERDIVTWDITVN